MFASITLEVLPMKPFRISSIIHMSYWDFFQQYYKPLLQDIDILLKSMEGPISVADAAKALVMSEEITKDILKDILLKEEIQLIDQKGFWDIAMHGNSHLCRLLQRQCLCGSPDIYSPEHIAYIYGLQTEHVTEVCKTNGYTEIFAQNLEDILNKIYIYIMQ